MKTVPKTDAHPPKKKGRSRILPHPMKRQPVPDETATNEERTWTGWTEIDEPEDPEDGVEPPASQDDLPEY